MKALSPISTALALVALSLVAGCGSESSLVGGRCADGMELAGTTCVAPTPAPTVVAPSVPPVGSASGESPGAATEGPQKGPYQIAPTVPVDPTHPRDPIEPFQPIVTPPEPPPVTPPELVCAAPLFACHGACIPFATDPMNCGACGKVCPSNLCVASECTGATPGDVVLIGLDYSNASAGTSQSKILVNALTIPTTDPIRVLSYEEGASAAAVQQAQAIAALGIRGRTIEFTTAQSATTLESDTLSRSYDIVLLHEAGGADPVATGQSWASSLGIFTRKGGVVIALDRGTSPMPELLSSSGLLLSVFSHTVLPAETHMQVTAAGDVVGAQVLSPYAAFGAPVSFQGLDAPSLDFSWVVRSTSAGGTLSDPVVVHRVVRELP